MLNLKYTTAIAKALLNENSKHTNTLEYINSWQDIDERTWSYTTGWRYAYIHAVKNFEVWKKLKNLEIVQYSEMDINNRSLNENLGFSLLEYPTEQLKQYSINRLLIEIVRQQESNIIEIALKMTEEQAMQEYNKQREKNKNEYNNFVHLKKGFDNDIWDYSDPTNWTYKRLSQKRKHPDIVGFSYNVRKFFEDMVDNGHLIECKATDYTTYQFPYKCNLTFEDFKNEVEKYYVHMNDILSTRLITNRKGKPYINSKQMWNDFFRRK